MGLLSRFREWRSSVGFTPTRRFVLLIVGGSPLWLLSRTGSFVIVAQVVLGASVLLLLYDVARLPARNDFDVDRRFPDTIGVGDEGEGTFDVKSRWNEPLFVTLFDRLPAKFVTSHHIPVEMELSPAGALTQPFSATGEFRGASPLGDVALRVRTPLGLATRTFRYPQSDTTLVSPSLAGVRRFRWLAVHHRLASMGIRSTRRRGEGRSFSRLRDYVPGDDPRHIDWKATARRARPITREFTVEQSQSVFVLVDAGRTMTQIAGDYPRFEYALSATLLLADVATTAGDRVGAMVFDDKIRALVPPQRGATAMYALRSALIPVQPSFVEPDYAAAFGTLASRQRKRALIVLFTDVVDARVARSLQAQFTRGGARHLVVVVALRNETLLAEAVHRGRRTSDMYRSAAAEELVAERLTALQRMRDAGIVVLDVPPAAMAAAVVNQYLELKSRGAI